VHLTRTQALEAIAHGIRVNAIGVGDVVTNILNHFLEDGREFLAEHGRNAPIGRAAWPRRGARFHVIERQMDSQTARQTGEKTGAGAVPAQQFAPAQRQQL
ncbi:SDR family oxidoreductase, partial [Sodalis-like symbiont of Bactericera trigonica]